MISKFLLKAEVSKSFMNYFSKSSEEHDIILSKLDTE